MVSDLRGTECARPDVHRLVGEPQMGRGLHLPLDLRRLALCGRGPRSFLSMGRRLVHECDDDDAARHRCASDGHLVAGQTRDRVASF